jgi:hypothetical protein
MCDEYHAMLVDIIHTVFRYCKLFSIKSILNTPFGNNDNDRSSLSLITSLE